MKLQTFDVLEELRKINYQHIGSLTDEKIAWMYRHLVLMRHEHKAYALTITFLPHRQLPRGHKPETVKQMMINLYLHKLVRDHLFDGHSNWAKKYGEFQPFAEFYTEMHTHGAVHRPHLDNKTLKQYEFADRLHYHGIMFVDPMHVGKMEALLPDNSLKRFHKGVMTSVIKPVEDIGWSAYMLKHYQANSDTSLAFGQNLKDRQTA